MTGRFRNLALFLPVSTLLMMVAIVEATAGDVPVLVKGKFETPVELERVVEDWKARGYSDWVNSWKEKGWSTNSSYYRICLRTVLEGRVEYIINGQSFILEPGDELFSPANATYTARNLHEGFSKMLMATTP